MSKEVEDIVGNTYHKWKVVSKTDKRTKCGRILYLCVCECKTIGYVPSYALRKGKSKSCGCLQKGNNNMTKKERIWGNDKV